MIGIVMLFNPIHPLLLYTPFASLYPVDIRIQRVGPSQHGWLAVELEKFSPEVKPCTFDSEIQQNTFRWSKIVYELSIDEMLDRARRHRAPAREDVVVKDMLVNYSAFFGITSGDEEDLIQLFENQPPWSWITVSNLESDSRSFDFHPFTQERSFKNIAQFLDGVKAQKFFYVWQYWYSVAARQFVLVFTRLMIATLDGSVLVVALKLVSLCGLIR